MISSRSKPPCGRPASPKPPGRPASVATAMPWALPWPISFCCCGLPPVEMVPIEQLANRWESVRRNGSLV